MERVTLPLGGCFEYGTLRSLREEDVAPMLSWMHDDATAALFARDFRSMTEGDALGFVRSSWGDPASVHLAVAADDGTYLGTVSLKRVDALNGCAEYAVAMVPSARGTGAAESGTRDVLRLAFGPLGLHRVYLDVRESNTRAIRFYERLGFVYEGAARDAIRCGGRFEALLWYSMLDGELG